MTPKKKCALSFMAGLIVTAIFEACGIKQPAGLIAGATLGAIIGFL